MKQRRTWWCLESLGHKPSDYEVCSTALLYAPTEKRGFEVPTPAGAFWLRHGADRTLGSVPWANFRDPRATTYAGYVQRRHERELFVDGLYAQLEGGARDLALDPEFRRTLGASLSALRFPLHGLQMASSYLGSVAPSGEVAIACAFQAADELRRVQRLAQRMGHLRRADPALDPELDGRGRRDWEQAPQWQPLRRCVEGLLVTYDFVEAFVALQEAVKPQVDALLFQGVAMAARRAGDDVTASALGALEEDAAWHREWSAALLSVMDGAERGKGAVADLRQRWAARAAEAVAPLRGGGTAF